MSVSTRALDNVDEQLRTEVAAQAFIWATQNGLLYGAGGDYPSSMLVHAPMSLLPTPLPRDAYEKGVALTEICNKLTDAISKDEPYLRETLAEVCQSDPFTAKLMEIFESSREEAAKYDAALGILSGVVHKTEAELHRSGHIIIHPKGVGNRVCSLSDTCWDEVLTL
ncbi:hypothetical protein CYMTET_33018 [Cymbomonas tetramitiformis]|uniref:Uncharacterized protein n=1 Tax=Cymbomonas tetramitiformis TaxID=36881 RepID=A0AAE0FE90_9CHLO|nr:hypothetical protein CYMTET_33018 [Cymbomonas tetramitiformis]